jgi:hypothetical protein
LNDWEAEVVVDRPVDTPTVMGPGEPRSDNRGLSDPPDRDAQPPRGRDPQEPATAAEAPWRAELDQLARSLGIKIEYRDISKLPRPKTKQVLRYSDPSEADLARSVPFLVSELRRLPAPVVARTGLKRVVLCRNLSVDLRPRAGLAVPDAYTLYVDVSLDGQEQLTVRRVIHHEVFHLIDVGPNAAADDQAWRQLNPAGFEYKRGTSGMTDDPTVLLSRTAPPGFVSKYATVASEEDRAEVFAFLMADPEGLAKKVAENPVVAAKVRCLQSILARYSNGDEFWTSTSAPGRAAADSAPTPQVTATDWPECARALPAGDHEVRIRNPNPVAVKVGLRSQGAGLDLDVPATATRSVQVPTGVYEVFFCYQGNSAEVLQGDDIKLTLPGQGIQLTLVTATGAGNYRLRRARKP